MSIEADFSEVNRLAVDLGRAADGLLPEVDAVAKKGAESIRRDLVNQVKGTSFRGMESAMSYDRDYRMNEVGYEIGPDKERGARRARRSHSTSYRGGAMGNIFFFGGAHGGGGTGDLDAPLRDEEPRFIKALGDVIEDRVTGL